MRVEEPKTLKCGCKRGFVLCPDAERLWAEVNSAYRSMYTGRQGDDSAYKDALHAYNDHFTTTSRNALRGV